MTKTERSLVTITSITLVGLIGDIIIYSLGESKGGPFRLHMPEKFEIIKLLALGAVIGVVSDSATRLIESTTLSEQEKKLQSLVDKEMTAIDKGLKKGDPVSVVYA